MTGPITFLTYLRKFWWAVVPIYWPCAYCDLENSTPAVLWHTVKYTLICRACQCMQDYPGHIKAFDPRPGDPSKRKR